MKQFMMMNDSELEKHVEQLKRDVWDFTGRAARVASDLKHEAREYGNDPLYQRFTSIRDFLQEKLVQAEGEVTRRAHEKPKRAGVSFGAALLELSSPWRRIRASK
ncbi:MAG: hypothetical protein ACT4PS_04640 [Betaproteobacteria bacterium]